MQIDMQINDGFKSPKYKKRLKPPGVWLVENNLWWDGVNLLRSTPDESHPQCQCWPGFKKWVESYPPQRQLRRVQYQIQFIPRLDLELVGLGWLNRYSELTRSTQKKKPINKYLAKETHHNKNQNFQRNQRFLYKRKPVKIWNKPVTLSKAFKKSLGWRTTYLTLNPPLSECRMFVFGALPMGM